MPPKKIKFFNINKALAVRVSFIKTIAALISLRRLSLVVCKGAHVYIRRKNITGGGRLIFGATWPHSISKPSQLVVARDGKLMLEGTSKLCHGANVSVASGARLNLLGCFVNNNANIACYHKISIGSGSVISENVIIRDDDGHSIPGKLPYGEIKIGEHVWIGMNVIILKNVTIGDGAIVAAGSVVTRSVDANCMAAGNPARIIKRDVLWD